MEKQIKDLETLIRIAISKSNLNVSIVELILRDIYREVKMLADKNLENKLKEQEEQSHGNTDEER